MSKTVELAGVVRNLPDITVPDGTMQEMINLRPKDGAWRPIGIKVGAMQHGLTDTRHIHRVSTTSTVYVGRSSGGYIEYYHLPTGGSPGAVVVTTITCTDTTRFASFRNTLMISEPVSQVTSILLEDENDMEYIEFNGTGGVSLLPDLPQVSLLRVAGDTDSYDYHAEGPTEDMHGYEHLEYIKNTMLAEYNRMQNKKADIGYLTGTLLFLYAWEMIDGTVIKQSIPYKFTISEIDSELAILPGPPVDFRITTDFTGYTLQYKLNCTSEWLTEVKLKYKNLVASLNIYISLPRAPEVKDDGDIFGITIEEYNPKIEDETYFLLKQFNLDTLVANTFTDLTLETVKDLDTKIQAPINNLSHHALYGERLFVYNDRIFLGNIKNYPFKGPPLLGLIEPYDIGVYSTHYFVGIEFDIVVSSRKIVTVFTGWSEYNYYNEGGNIDFWIRKPITAGNSFWGYPDARAKTARVLLTVTGGSPIKLAATISLTSVQDKNISYSPSTEVNVNFSALPLSALSTNGNYYYDENRIQATEIGNPFFYPAINSYRVQGTVLGMSTNAIAISQGQFGQYPLFAFTSEGIWALRIGTGELLIVSVDPLSREVCNNPDSITGIDGGSVFTTGKGLFIVSGNQVVELSAPAEGNYLSPLAGMATFDSILSNPNRYDISPYICDVSFLTYISGAIIAWNYKEKEIIVCNPDKTYSWVYSLAMKAWYKMGQVWDRFIPDYPVTYGYNTYGPIHMWRNITEETFSISYPFATIPPAHFETRPLKLSEAQYKKIKRMILEGWVNDSDEFQFSVHLFGTTDKISWVKLSSNTYNNQTTMISGRSPFSCRYFILVAGGKIDENSYFRSLVIDWEDKYVDKLRS